MIQDKIHTTLDQIGSAPQMSSNVLQSLGGMEEAIRLDRPGFAWLSTTSVQVAASSASPAYFLIGGRVLKSETTLVCDLSRNGLDTGAIAYSTVYYLYSVSVNDSPLLVCSIRPPTSGPIGWDQWTYLGSFATYSTDYIRGFVSSEGMMMSAAAVHPDVSDTGHTATWTSKAVVLPTTAKFAFMRMGIDGTVVNTYAAVSGRSDYAASIYQQLQVSGYINYAFGWVPISTAGTIYLYTQNASNTISASVRGWKENLKEFP